MPIGYNPTLDEALRSGAAPFPQESWLVRTNRRNDWLETDREDALAREYGVPFPNANGLYVGMIGGRDTDQAEYIHSRVSATGGNGSSPSVSMSR